MKKILSLALVLSGLFSVNAFAEMKIIPWSGYTKLTDTKAVNDYFKDKTDKCKKDHKKTEAAREAKRKKDIGDAGVDVKSTLNWEGDKKMGHALVVGADFLFDITDNLKIGMRTAFLQPNKAVHQYHNIETTTVDKKHADYNVRDQKYKEDIKNYKEHPELRLIKPDIYGYENIADETRLCSLRDSRVDDVKTFSLDTSFVPITFGVNYNLNIDEKLSLNGSLFAGYGIAKYKISETTSSLRNKRNELVPRNGRTLSSADGCYVGEASLGAQYLLAKGLALGLDVGYRYTSDVEIKEYFPLRLNFSGITARLTLSYKI
jgi:hypothetical protein